MKTVRQTIIEVDYFDLEQEVFSAFGQIWRFAEDQESGNDSFKLFTVDGKLSPYEQAELDVFKVTGRSAFIARTLLNELCRLGRIKAGRYIIRVAW